MDSAHLEAETKVLDKVSTTLQNLSRLWNEMGIESESRINRLGTVCEHVTALLDSMLDEEKGHLARVRDTIRELSRKTDELCINLGLPIFTPDSSLSLLQLRELLQGKVAELANEQSGRTWRLNELRDEESILCGKLGLTATVVSFDGCPSVKQLEEFEHRVKSLETEAVEKFQILEQLKKGVLLLQNELELTPETEFEKYAINTDDDAFVLSDSNMTNIGEFHKKLSALKCAALVKADGLKEELNKIWNQLCIDQAHKDAFLQTCSDCHPRTINSLKKELQRCKQLRLENLRRLTEEAKADLANLWKLCYISEEQIAGFLPYHTDIISEDNLFSIDTEISHLRQLYERKKEMFEKIKRREQLWLRYLELEQSSTDPQRFNNRGGNLLKAEKERAKLLKELPKVDSQIIGEIKDWEQMTGHAFLVEDMRFEDYVEQLWKDFREKKEADKHLRQQLKAKQFEKETTFGGRHPASPTKRKLNPSAASSVLGPPPKLRRMNEIQGTPSRVRGTPSSGLSCMSSHSLMRSKGHLPPSGNLCENDLRGFSEESRMSSDENNPLGADPGNDPVASLGLCQDVAVPVKHETNAQTRMGTKHTK